MHCSAARTGFPDGGLHPPAGTPLHGPLEAVYGSPCTAKHRQGREADTASETPRG
jgi:hypothetical protein